MSDAAPVYRWNTSVAAEAFDQAAEFIHPYYLTIHNEILDRLPVDLDAAWLLVDLGGGSGRLVERVLQKSAHARAVLIDQSEPFLALAERRLARFGPRAVLVQQRLQEDWGSDLPAKAQAIVSTSAIHHLDRGEKRTLFARCFEALSPGGVFINGDEFRPEGDAEYLALLEDWSAHMRSALARGEIPTSFKDTLDYWHNRNIDRFDEPKQSGDDCHETVAAQIGHLRDAGLAQTEIVWARQLWAVLNAAPATHT